MYHGSSASVAALGFIVMVGKWKDVFVPGVSDKGECGLGYRENCLSRLRMERSSIESYLRKGWVFKNRGTQMGSQVKAGQARESVRLHRLLC